MFNTARREKQLYVIAIDEKTKKIHSNKRKPIPMKKGRPEKYDNEYIRKGKEDCKGHKEENEKRLRFLHQRNS